MEMVLTMNDNNDNLEEMGGNLIGNINNNNNNLQNTEQKTVEMLLTMPTSAERAWWINTPHHSPADTGLYLCFIIELNLSF